MLFFLATALAFGPTRPPDPPPPPPLTVEELFATGVAALAAPVPNCNAAWGAFRAVIERDNGRVNAWYNLGYVADVCGNPGAAAAAYEQTLTLEPAHPGAARNLGALLLREGHAANAAIVYQRAVELGPDDAAHERALAAARLAAGDSGGAVAAWKRALELDPHDLDALRQLAVAALDAGDTQTARTYTTRARSVRSPGVHELGRPYEARARWAEAASIYQGFVARPPADATPEERVCAGLYHGVVLAELGQTGARDKAWTAALAQAEAAAITVSPCLAELRFRMAEERFTAYLALNIDYATLPPPGSWRGSPEDEALKRALVVKAKALQAIEQTYAAVAEADPNGWTVAAFTRTGEAYEEMSRALLESAIPARLTPDQRELYELALGDKAYTMREKAVRYYQLALERAAETQRYDTFTALCLTRLRVLRPSDYLGAVEVLPGPVRAPYASAP